jgi:hypothetical protein
MLDAEPRPGPRLARVQLAGRRLPGCLSLAQRRVVLAPSDVTVGLRMPPGSIGTARRRARTRLAARGITRCRGGSVPACHFRAAAVHSHRTCAEPARRWRGQRRARAAPAKPSCPCTGVRRTGCRRPAARAPGPGCAFGASAPRGGDTKRGKDGTAREARSERTHCRTVERRARGGGEEHG